MQAPFECAPDTAPKVLEFLHANVHTLREFLQAHVHTLRGLLMDPTELGLVLQESVGEQSDTATGAHPSEPTPNWVRADLPDDRACRRCWTG